MAFVTAAKTIAHTLDVPVEWLLAAMSWETSQYSAYDPVKLYVPGAVHGRKWIDPAEYQGAFPVDLLHWAHNPSDWDFGLVGFTPRPVLHIDPLHWKVGDRLPDSDSQAKLRMSPLEQLKNCVEDYFRTNIRNFSVPTPFATIEDFYCVVYAPGISGKPDSYSWTYAGTNYNKGTQMNIFRGFLSGYDYPKKSDDTGEQTAPEGLLGQWIVRIGNWVGMFVFNSSGDVWYATMPRSGAITEIAESARTGAGYLRTRIFDGGSGRPATFVRSSCHCQFPKESGRESFNRLDKGLSRCGEVRKNPRDPLWRFSIRLSDGLFV